MGLRERLWSARRLLPATALIVLVLGSIYGGYATPTEAATIGVIGALALSAGYRELTWAAFREGVLAATRTSCMLAFIVACASFLAVAMGFSGIPRNLAAWVQELDLSSSMLLLVLTLLYIVIGCFLDGISMIVLTALVVLPMVQAAGIDLLWFGIYIVIVVELAQITPPVGINLYALQGMTGADIWYITKAAPPFFFVMLLAVAIITVFPGLVTYLPNHMVMRP